jgi:hypothetical protein
MHFGKIADMLWLSQVFENVNIADMLESTSAFKTDRKPVVHSRYIHLSLPSSDLEYHKYF